MNASISSEWLDDFVSEHRVTISAVFPVIGAVLLILSATGSLPDVIAFNPWLILFGVIVMRLPLIVGLLPVLDHRAVLGLATLSLYSYIIEVVGVQTGWPYGWFSYGVSLGPMIAGVPVALPLLFLPLVLNAYLLVLLVIPSARSTWYTRIISVITVVLAIDFVLDPGAVSLGFWSYESSWLHGVPLSNYLGWVLSATVATIGFDAALRTNAVVNRLSSTPFMLDDLVSFTLLWGSVNAFYYNISSVLVALGFIGLLVHADRFDLPGITG
jgi:putative membrane protein